MPVAVSTSWTAIVLAAGRGPNDPLARAFDVSHKCLIPVAGTPMLARVVKTLSAHPLIGRIRISVESPDIVDNALGPWPDSVEFVASKDSAARSAAHGLEQGDHRYPQLITTADHALLTTEMLDHFLTETGKLDTDLTAGLASAETILAVYPDARRTFLRFGPDRVSGCNLYGLKTPAARKVVDFWQRVEQDRKKPWRLVGHFGLEALLRYLSRTLTLETAFELASRRLGITARPVLMPFAEAATDVDKPEDKQLVEEILAARQKQK